MSTKHWPDGSTFTTATVACMTLYALLIPADVTIPASKHSLDENDLLRSLQKAVGGYVEDINAEGCTFLAHEEEKFKKDHVHNLRADAFLVAKGRNLAQAGDYLAGDVLVGAFDEDGDMVSLPDTIIDQYRTRIGEVTDAP